MTNGFKEEHRMQLQALIDAACITDPQLRERITIEAALQLIKLPDSAFGWGVDEGQMAEAVKVNAVILHLRLGAIPGLKHLLWMKNGFYPTAAFFTYRVNKNVKKLGPKVYKPLSSDERIMFFIKDDDMACTVEEEVELDGVRLLWSGIGIIGADEYNARDKYGNPRPGMQTTKNRMKTLKTRAVNDMYARNYPVEGVTVSAEDLQESDVQDERKKTEKDYSGIKALIGEVDFEA